MRRSLQNLLVFIFIGFSLVCFTKTSFAQPTITVTAQPSNIKIGDYIHLDIAIQQIPSNSTFTIPDYGEVFSKDIELVDVANVDTITKDNAYTIHCNVVVSIYNSGSFYIPSVPFKYQHQGEWHTVSSDSILVEVAKIEVDTTQDIKDINDIVPVEAPSYFWQYALIIFIVAFLLFALIFSIYKYYKAKKLTNTNKLAHLSLHDRYLVLLEDLIAQQYIEQQKFKEYYVGLSDILRSYIVERYSIAAMELTTQQLLKQAKRTPTLKRFKNELKDVLEFADLIKFAKASADGLIALKHHQMVTEFVKRTRVKEENL